MKFFHDTKENQLETEIISNVFIRSNMSSKNQLEEIKKINRMSKESKMRKPKRAFVEESQFEFNVPEYKSEPTPEEIVRIFNLILKEGEIPS